MSHDNSSLKVRKEVDPRKPHLNTSSQATSSSVPVHNVCKADLGSSLQQSHVEQFVMVLRCKFCFDGSELVAARGVRGLVGSIVSQICYQKYRDRFSQN